MSRSPAFNMPREISYPIDRRWTADKMPDPARAPDGRRLPPLRRTPPAQPEQRGWIAALFGWAR